MPQLCENKLFSNFSFRNVTLVHMRSIQTSAHVFHASIRENITEDLTYMSLRKKKGYCPVVVLHAVMTDDRSIGAREVGSGKFCTEYYLRIRGSAPRGACTAMALSCRFEKGGCASQIRGFDPRVSRQQLTGHEGLTRE